MGGGGGGVHGGVGRLGAHCHWCGSKRQGW